MEARGRGRRGVNLEGDVKRYERIGCPAAGNTVRAVRIRRMRTSSKPTAGSLGANALRGGGVARASGSPPTPTLFGAAGSVSYGLIFGAFAPRSGGVGASSWPSVSSLFGAAASGAAGLRGQLALRGGRVVAARSVARRARPSGRVARCEPGTPCVACLPLGAGVALARCGVVAPRGGGVAAVACVPFGAGGVTRATSVVCVACVALRGGAASRTRARLQAGLRSSERWSCPWQPTAQPVPRLFGAAAAVGSGPVPAFAPRSAGGMG